MKKIVLSLLINILIFLPVFANTDKTSEEYLKNKKHFAIINPISNRIIQKIIKKSLINEIGKGSYKVHFDSYTLGSLKKGIFKNLEINGKHLTIKDIPVNSLTLKTTTDYNWIDFSHKPISIKSDIAFDYELELTEDSLNKALEKKDYKKTLEKINKKAYPLFTMHNVKIRIKNENTYIIMDYSLPLSTHSKTKTFMVSAKFKAENGKIKASNVQIDNAYGNLPLDKVTNLINLLDPLSFTLDILKKDNCKGKIENVKMKDNIIQIGGKMYITKGE